MKSVKTELSTVLAHADDAVMKRFTMNQLVPVDTERPGAGLDFEREAGSLVNVYRGRWERGLVDLRVFFDIITCVSEDTHMPTAPRQPSPSWRPELRWRPLSLLGISQLSNTSLLYLLMQISRPTMGSRLNPDMDAVMQLKITVPTAHLTRALKSLYGRDCKIENTVSSADGVTTIDATGGLTRLFMFAANLRNFTGGRATCTAHVTHIAHRVLRGYTVSRWRW
jgi:hypothetical protein